MDPSVRMRRMSTSSFSPGKHSLSNTSSNNSTPNRSPRFSLTNSDSHNSFQRSASNGNVRSDSSEISNGRGVMEKMETTQVASPVRSPRIASGNDEIDSKANLSRTKTIIL